MQDISKDLTEMVAEAASNQIALDLRGSSSKAFYGRTPIGQPVDLRGHTGIVNYEPTELVLTARCGTPLHNIESLLAENNQMLAFEPPYFGRGATLGGAVASGLSGPRRPYTGAVRDTVLGTQILNGKAEVLSFGGEVMKNVAGYDLSRLMAGSLGTLGVILQVSIRVVPKPVLERTLTLKIGADGALDLMKQWAGQPVPLSGLCWIDDCLYTRLSGSEASVYAAMRQLDGEQMSNGDRFWQQLRDHSHSFFAEHESLWRLSVAPNTPMLDLAGHWVLDWGGAQRWLVSEEPPDSIFAAAAAVGGYACRFRCPDRELQIFHPLPKSLEKIQRRVKQAFDPNGIFNQFRMYAEW